MEAYNSMETMNIIDQVMPAKVSPSSNNKCVIVPFVIRHHFNIDIISRQRESNRNNKEGTEKVCARRVPY